MGLQVAAMLQDVVPAAPAQPRGNLAALRSGKGDFDSVLQGRETSRAAEESERPDATPVTRRDPAPVGPHQKRQGEQVSRKAQREAVKADQKEKASETEVEEAPRREAAAAGKEGVSQAKRPQERGAGKDEAEALPAEPREVKGNAAAVVADGQTASAPRVEETASQEAAVAAPDDTMTIAGVEAAVQGEDAGAAAEIPEDGAGQTATADGEGGAGAAAQAQQEPGAEAKSAPGNGANPQFVRSQPQGGYFQQTVAARHGAAKDEPAGLANAAKVIAENRERQGEKTAARQEGMPQQATLNTAGATEGAQVAEASALQGEKVPATEQQQPVLQKGEPEKSGETPSLLKNVHGAGESHATRHFRGEPAQPKEAESQVPVGEISGAGAETPADAAQVAAQGQPGQEGSGGAAGNGHQEQNAHVKQGTELFAAVPGGQGPAAQSAVENTPAPQRSALHESILSQVKEGVVTHDGKGNGEVSIRLNPGELGELKIQVRMDDNRLRVEVQADNRMVKDLLMSNLDSLKEALSGKSFTMDGFNVSTGGGGFDNPLAEQRGQQPAPRLARSGYGDADRAEGRVKYLTAEVNSLLDVRL